MNDFKSEYRSAVQDMNMPGMKEIHIDAFSVLDKGRHRRHVVKRVQRVTAMTFSAACVIFLCGFGTVKAAEYIGNVIKVSEWGFESGDSVTMARNDAGAGQPYVLEDEIGIVASGGQEAMPELVAGSAVTAGDMEISDGEEGTAARGAPDMQAVSEENRKMSGMEDALALEAEAVPELQSADIMATEDIIETEAMAETEAVAETEEAGLVEEIPVKNYASWEECMENEDFIFPQPSVSIGQHVESTDIMVCGNWVMVRYDVDEKVLWLERTDYADTQGHASSKVFPGGICNERSYTTPQGYTYTLIDSVKAAEDEPLQIHAAVSVGHYEAFIDFMGYTEEEAKKIIDSIDLSVYE